VDYEITELLLESSFPAKKIIKIKNFRGKLVSYEKAAGRFQNIEQAGLYLSGFPFTNF
jgi:hypothetical protein